MCDMAQAHDKDDAGLWIRRTYKKRKDIHTLCKYLQLHNRQTETYRLAHTYIHTHTHTHTHQHVIKKSADEYYLGRIIFLFPVSLPIQQVGSEGREVLWRRRAISTSAFFTEPERDSLDIGWVLLISNVVKLTIAHRSKAPEMHIWEHSTVLHPTLFTLMTWCNLWTLDL